MPRAGRLLLVFFRLRKAQWLLLQFLGNRTACVWWPHLAHGTCVRTLLLNVICGLQPLKVMLLCHKHPTQCTVVSVKSCLACCCINICLLIYCYTFWVFERQGIRLSTALESYPVLESVQSHLLFLDKQKQKQKQKQCTRFKFSKAFSVFFRLLVFCWRWSAASLHVLTLPINPELYQARCLLHLVSLFLPWWHAWSYPPCRSIMDLARCPKWAGTPGMGHYYLFALLFFSLRPGIIFTATFLRASFVKPLTQSSALAWSNLDISMWWVFNLSFLRRISHFCSTCHQLSHPQNIDDCWALGRYPNGTVYPDPVNFPSGMKALGDYSNYLS